MRSEATDYIMLGIFTGVGFLDASAVIEWGIRLFTVLVLYRRLHKDIKREGGLKKYLKNYFK
jgi:hypothetical protein